MYSGSHGWKEFPDARPVRANGEYLDAATGGMCPTHEGWRRIRLDLLASWLQVQNAQELVSLRLTSSNRFDPQGRPAVHCTRKIQLDIQMLICVNTFGTYTEAEIDIPAERQTHWRGYVSDEQYMVVGGDILARFAPYEVLVFLETK